MQTEPRAVSLSSQRLIWSSQAVVWLLRKTGVNSQGKDEVTREQSLLPIHSSMGTCLICTSTRSLRREEFA